MYDSPIVWFFVPGDNKVLHEWKIHLVLVFILTDMFTNCV